MATAPSRSSWRRAGRVEAAHAKAQAGKRLDPLGQGRRFPGDERVEFDHLRWRDYAGQALRELGELASGGLALACRGSGSREVRFLRRQTSIWHVTYPGPDWYDVFLGLSLPIAAGFRVETG
jgi:hypothetical protein